MFEAIAKFLQEVNPYELDQFTIDWIEFKSDKFIHSAPRSESERQTMTEALNYEVRRILEIMRDDAKGRPFFEAMLRLSYSNRSDPPVFFQRTRWA